MPIDDRFDDTVRRVTSDVLGIAPDRLRGDRSLMDLKAADGDYETIMERSAEALGIDLRPIIESMPVYSVKAGEATLASLQMIAAVSPRAASLLDQYTVRPIDDTLASIGATLRTGRFVDSGRRQPPAHAPYSRAKFLFRLATPFVVLLGLFPLVSALLGYLQRFGMSGTFLWDYVAHTAYRSEGMIALALALLVFDLGRRTIPGILAVWADSRRRRARRDI